MMVYTIEEHRHRFAAWAAGRAASVNGCRFKVEQGKAILEAVELNLLVASPGNLPLPQEMDATHKEWRSRVIQAAQAQGLVFTHGAAAKLINVYLKAVFVCGGYHDHDRVRALHPPIDSLLLDELAKQNIGGFRRQWNEARKVRWSNLSSDQYELVIDCLRKSLSDNALWKAEQYWRGFQ